MTLSSTLSPLLLTPQRAAPLWRLSGARLARCLLGAAAVGLSVGCAQLPGADVPLGGAAGGAPPEPGIVSVTFDAPARSAGARSPNAAAEPWAQALAGHLAERAAAQLPKGQRLEVRLQDIRRAGRHDEAVQVRQVSEQLPPRIDLAFTLRTAEGRVLRQGQRQLREPGFLMRPTRYPGDPLRHEKALIDGWLAREFAPAASTTPAREAR